MDQTSADLQLLELDQRQPVSTFDGIQVGKVVAVIGSTVTFTIPDFDDHATFGPAPYPGSAPDVGTTCVVGFVGNNIQDPYVLAFYGS